MNKNRRNFINLAGYGTLASVLPVTALSKTKLITNDSIMKKYSKKAITIVEKTTCVDMLTTYGDSFNHRNKKTLEELWNKVPNSFTEEDYKFVKSCGINVFGWGNMIPTYEGMLKFMAYQNGIIASNPDYFQRIDCKAAFEKNQNNNKIGMLMTNQDSKHFRTLDDINLFHELGQRVSQLTYNDKNAIGFGAFEEVDSGLTQYGKQVVERMNTVGMAVDVSHCGDETTLGGIHASSKPVLITHGACRALAKGLARTKTDEAIIAMAKTGGVIGIPILRFMIREKEPVNIEHFFNHIDHVAQLVGIEHVGIGSDQGLYTEDYDKIELRKSKLTNAPAKYQTHTNEDYLLTIKGLNHPHRTYDIAEGLLKRGYKDEHVKMVLGENFKRVLMNIFKY